jgi:hypothetical protein
MITLQHFESQVNPTILQRGKQYYSKKAVTWLEDTGNGKWLAAVEGTENYQVDITLVNKDEVREFACDCPFDGPLCKHVVAVFFALREELNETKSRGQKRKNTAKEAFEKLRKAISPEEYQAFIRRYALRNKAFKTDFELYFAGKDDRLDVAGKYKDILRKLIRKYGDHGFVSYRDALALSKEVDKVLAQGQDFLLQHNFHDAFAIAREVLTAMRKVITVSDDSEGYIGAALYDAGQLIVALATAEGVDKTLKEQLCTFLQKKLNDARYFDYGDIGDDLVIANL